MDCPTLKVSTIYNDCQIKKYISRRNRKIFEQILGLFNLKPKKQLAHRGARPGALLKVPRSKRSSCGLTRSWGKPLSSVLPRMLARGNTEPQAFATGNFNPWQIS